MAFAVGTLRERGVVDNTRRPMRIGRIGPWALVLAVGAGLGLAIAGVPSRGEDPPLRVGGTTTVPVTAPAEATVSSVPSDTAPQGGTQVPPFPGTISLGDTGDHVRQWQQRMHDRGWDIEVDGQFGLGAKEICQRFQRQKGLVPNGTVDEATWDATWSAALPDDVN